MRESELEELKLRDAEEYRTGLGKRSFEAFLLPSIIKPSPQSSLT